MHYLTFMANKTTASAATILGSLIRDNTLNAAPAAVTTYLATADLADLATFIGCDLLGLDSRLILDIAFMDATVALGDKMLNCKVGSRLRATRRARYDQLCATHDVLRAQGGL